MPERKKFNLWPLKWDDLKDTVESLGVDNPEIWIEDLHQEGLAGDMKAEPVGDTKAVPASFSTITDLDKGRIIICHHY